MSARYLRDRHDGRAVRRQCAAVARHDSKETAIRFSVLGPLEISTDEGPVALRAAKQQALLAVLLCEANRPVSMERLIDLLWTASPPRTAQENLRLYVYHVRRALDGPDRIERRSPGYALTVHDGELDADRFEELARQGEAALAAGDPTLAAAVLAEGLALWRGPAYAGLGELDLLRDAAARLAERRRAVLEARIEADLALGRHREIVAELTGLVAEFPLVEGLRGQLMLALYRSGRQAEALGSYRDGRRLLADELGLEPGPELRRLEQAILTGDPSVGPAGRAPIQAANPAPGAPVPHLLCGDVTDFVGRGEQLAELDRLVAAPGAGTPASPDATASCDAATVAIVGTPGVGKTALAVHWAHRSAERFPDGQLYLNLRGYSAGAPVEPVEALAVFLRALGVPAEQVPVDVDEAAGLYRTLLAGRRMLVLLDNACSADQVRPLLPGAPGCLAVITSRDRLSGLLARHGARRLSLDVLSQPESHALLTRILGPDRMAAEPDAATALARACAHLPLALRITAANLVDDPYRSIADEVSELTHGSPLTALEIAGDEDAAVRAAFDLSYARLTEDAQRLFRLLGLVPGPDLTAPAAARLTDAPAASVGRLLGRLAGAHLIEQHGPGRYAFHDLLRVYAAERAHQHESAPERAAAITRLYEHYLYRADAAARLLYPEKLRLPLPAGPAGDFDFADREQALAWFDTESATLVAAVTEPPPQLPGRWAWLLADVMRGYVSLRSHPEKWLAVANAGLAAAQAADDAQAQAITHLSLAYLHTRQGGHAVAVDHYSRTLQLSKQAGWLSGQAAALGTLGTTCWLAGRLDEAVAYLHESLALDRETGRLGGQGATLANLGLVCFEQGRLEDAHAHLAESLALTRQHSSQTAVGIVSGNLGVVLQALGRLDEARSHLAESVSLHRAAADDRREAEYLAHLASVHCAAGELATARDLAETALTMAADSGEPRYEAMALNSLAEIERCLGEHARSGERHRDALLLARTAENRYSEVEALIGIAAAAVEAGDTGGARAYSQQAGTMARQSGYRLLEARARTVAEAAAADPDRPRTSVPAGR